jgi:plastocyanin domain-containing protein
MNSFRIAVLAAALFCAPMALAAEKAAPAAGKAARTVELTVTDQGLAPSEVKLAKGETVRLGITRKTDKTCMTEVVVADLGVKQPLPLNKTVYVDVTPAKAGSLKVLCGMGMEFGRLVVN